jgi:hypothetical protein
MQDVNGRMKLLECLHDPGESFPSFGAPSPISGEPAEEEYPLISRIPAQKSSASGTKNHKHIFCRSRKTSVSCERVNGHVLIRSNLATKEAGNQHENFRKRWLVETLASVINTHIECPPKSLSSHISML